MICTGCLDDRSDSAIVYDDGGDMVFCRDCWPEWKGRVESMNERERLAGHTGDALCGCEICAARFEREA